MRAAVLAVCLAGCTVGVNRGPAAPRAEAEDTMPSEVLDRQDPGADTSRNPVTYVSGGGSVLDGLFGNWGSPSSPFLEPAGAPHYYKGCGGCSTDGPGGGPWLAAALALGLRRRRRAWHSLPKD